MATVMTREEYEAKYGRPAPNVPAGTAVRAPKVDPNAIVLPKSTRFEVASLPAPAETQEQKITRLKADSQKYTDEAKKNNSVLGFAGNFGKGLRDTFFASEVALGETIGKILDPNPQKNVKHVQSLTDSNIQLVKLMRERSAKGEDISNLQRMYNTNQDLIDKIKTDIIQYGKDLPTTGEVVGQLGGTAFDVLSAGQYGKANQGLKSFQNPTINKLLGETVESTAGAILPSAVKTFTPAGKATGLFTRQGAGRIATGGVLGYVGDTIQGLQGNRGEEYEWGGDKFGQPGVGTALGVILPTVLEADQTLTNIKNKMGAKADKITAGLQSGDIGGEEFATTKIVNGQKVPDELGSKAVFSGIPAKNVSNVKAMSTPTKNVAKKMYEIYVKGDTNAEFAKFNRAQDAFGESFLELPRKIAEKNSEAGKQLGTIVKGLKGQVVDYAPAVQSFQDELTEAGVKFADDGTLNFDGSKFDDISGAQKVINSAWKRISKQGLDASDLHNTKKYIDDLVYGAKAKEGLTGTAENLVRGLRRSIDQTLDNSFDDYRIVNDNWRATNQVMDDVANALGGKFDVDNGTFSDMQAGKVIDFMSGNSAGRVKAEKLMNSLDEIAKVYGIPNDVEYGKLAAFMDALTDIGGTQQTTSFRGHIARGGEEVLKGNVLGGVVGTAQNVAKEKLLGQTRENQFEILRQLLDDYTDDASALKNVMKGTSASLDEANRAVLAQITNDDLLKKGLKDVPYADMDDTMRAMFYKQTIQDHLNEARDVLNNIPKERLNELGGMQGLIKRLQINITNGLEAYGAKDVANQLRQVSTNAGSIEEYARALESIIK